MGQPPLPPRELPQRLGMRQWEDSYEHKMRSKGAVLMVGFDLDASVPEVPRHVLQLDALEELHHLGVELADGRQSRNRQGSKGHRSRQ